MLLCYFSLYIYRENTANTGVEPWLLWANTPIKRHAWVGGWPAILLCLIPKTSWFITTIKPQLKNLPACSDPCSQLRVHVPGWGVGGCSGQRPVWWNNFTQNSECLNIRAELSWWEFLFVFLLCAFVQTSITGPTAHFLPRETLKILKLHQKSWPSCCCCDISRRIQVFHPIRPSSD